MKKVLLYCSFLILFISCDNNSTPDKKEISEKNIISKEVIKVVTEVNNCPPFELDVYLNDPHDSGTNIRKSPKGEVLIQLKKDEQDDAYFLTLTEARNGWFKIKNPIGSMENDIQIPNGEGWIHGSVVSFHTRNYGGQKLELLDKPENGKVVGILKEESYGFKLKDVCGTWVKVEYKGIIGWIEDKWLCGNPLTTCS